MPFKKGQSGNPGGRIGASCSVEEQEACFTLRDPNGYVLFR